LTLVAVGVAVSLRKTLTDPNKSGFFGGPAFQSELSENFSNCSD